MNSINIAIGASLRLRPWTARRVPCPHGAKRLSHGELNPMGDKQMIEHINLEWSRRLASIAQSVVPLLATLCLATAWAGAPAASMTQTTTDDEPTQLVRETTENVVKAIEERGLTPEHDDGIVALVDEIVSPHVDYERVSQWVLGRHWREASPAQQSQFIEELRRLLTRMYANAILEHTEAPIEYLRESENGNGEEAAVRTLIEREGKAPIHIGYRLHNEHGAWKVFDIIVEGTSLISTHRAAFSAEIENNGIDGLIHTLAARNGGESS